RHGWVMFLVDLVATCSMHEGAYQSGYLKWETPEDVDPIFPVDDALIAVGVDGELLERSVAQQRGYVVKMLNSVFQIGIPYNAEGGRRKSLALDGLYEFYVFNLYVEQILLEGDQVDARLRVFRTLVTPLLPRPLFCENGTLLAERMFLAYLGDVPEDVVLVSVGLNGQEFPLQAQTLTGFTVTEVAHANNTRGYTLKVPFDHPVVQQQQDRAMQYVLMIQFTLHVLPEERPVYHQTSVTVLLDASPPAINASCSDSGIRFTLEHRPSEHPWQITIGSELLTSELAARHGYVLSNHSQRLQLDVPLFTAGYEYKNVSLKGFAGTFEVHLQDPKSAEVHSWVQTCPFSLSQYIFCSRNGVMTVVADLSPMVQSGLDPARTSLLSKDCRPTESDGTRVLYSFPLNSCGNT
uniref:ZP domain-containing protein n=1 Tax=Tetraodon nigroviridis TaxID=99883 RepID=H3C2Q2_TETNG